MSSISRGCEYFGRTAESGPFVTFNKKDNAHLTKDKLKLFYPITADGVESLIARYQTEFGSIFSAGDASASQFKQENDYIGITPFVSTAHVRKKRHI